MSTWTRRPADVGPAMLVVQGERIRRALLACGVLSSFIYAAMLAIVPMGWEDYSSASQAVSELSAIGAPTRALWVPLGAVYALLVAGFGVGVWISSGARWRLRIVGGALIVQSVVDVLWPPMHLRGSVTTLTDTLHVVFAIAWLLVMLVAIGAGAAALGTRFRLYSAATVATFIVFGAWSFVDGPRIAANLPTPWLGVRERINIGAALLWNCVLAVALLRHRRVASSSRS